MEHHEKYELSRWPELKGKTVKRVFATETMEPHVYGTVCIEFEDGTTFEISEGGQAGYIETNVGDSVTHIEGNIYRNTTRELAENMVDWLAGGCPGTCDKLLDVNEPLTEEEGKRLGEQIRQEMRIGEHKLPDYPLWLGPPGIGKTDLPLPETTADELKGFPFVSPYMAKVMEITETEADWDAFIDAECKRLEISGEKADVAKQAIDDHEMIHRVIFAEARGVPLSQQPEYVQRRYPLAIERSKRAFTIALYEDVLRR